MQTYITSNQKETFEQLLIRNGLLISKDPQANQFLYLISMCIDQSFPFQNYLSDTEVDFKGILKHMQNKDDLWLFFNSLSFINYNSQLRVEFFPTFVIVERDDGLDDYYSEAFKQFVYWSKEFNSIHATYRISKDSFQ